MSSPTSILAHVERTARLAKKALAASKSFYLPQLQEFVAHGTRVVRKALVEPSNFADPSSRGFFLPLINKLVQIKHERPDGGVFAFTSVSSGEGVSYVVQALAREIAQHTAGQILMTTARGLRHLVPADLPDAGKNDARTTRVWHVNDTYHEPCAGSADFQLETMELLRRRFDYVLIDCPTLGESTATLSLARASDGVLLVVAAGEVRREQVEQAQELIQGSSSNLLGLILNKRTYPVPAFIDRHF